jgi:hypothetical protein
MIHLEQKDNKELGWKFFGKHTQWCGEV